MPLDRPHHRELVELDAISTYVEQLAALDAKVAECRRAGLRGMSRSELIRIAVQPYEPCPGRARITTSPGLKPAEIHWFGTPIYEVGSDA